VRSLEGLISSRTLMESDLMSERMSEHPILVYLTFVLPILLLVLGMVFNASVILMILVLAWLGIALVILFLPIASNDGSPR